MATQPWTRVRMLRTPPSMRVVLDLEMGEIYALPPSVAAQFLENGMAEPVAEEKPLETAALRTGVRRG